MLKGDVLQGAPFIVVRLIKVVSILEGCKTIVKCLYLPSIISGR